MVFNNKYQLNTIYLTFYYLYTFLLLKPFFFYLDVKLLIRFYLRLSHKLLGKFCQWLFGFIVLIGLDLFCLNIRRAFFEVGQKKKKKKKNTKPTYIFFSLKIYHFTILRHFYTILEAFYLYKFGALRPFKNIFVQVGP